jgi:hypothetical protein
MGVKLLHELLQLMFSPTCARYNRSLYSTSKPLLLHCLLFVDKSQWNQQSLPQGGRTLAAAYDGQKILLLQLQACLMRLRC